MNIIWKIEWLKVSPFLDGFKDVVVEAGWGCSIAQELAESTKRGTDCGVAKFAFNQANFTQYEGLTEDQILTWIFDSGLDKKSVESKIVEKMNPAQEVKQLPWKISTQTVEV